MGFWTHPWSLLPGKKVGYVMDMQSAKASNDSSSSLYIGMGFFGYLKYGSDIASTITLNMDLVSILTSFLNQDIKPLPGISRCPFFSFSRGNVTGCSTGRGSPGHVQHRHLLLLRSAGWIYDDMTWWDLTFFPPNIFDGVTWWDLTFVPPSSMLSWTSWDPMSSDQTCPQKGFVTCHL